MFKRSGSVSRYHVEGSVPAPEEPAFAEALATRRFRTIENAASEEISFGWVTAADPTGNTFDAEDFVHDDCAWLRIRVDRKKLPAAWLQIHRAAAEKSAGRPLSAREKRELKEGLLEQLLPRVLPTVSLIDVVWYPRRRIALLFSTAKAVRDAFDKLFRETFDALPQPAEPYELALAVGLDADQVRRLDEVRPVQWRREAHGPTPSRRPEPSPVAAEFEDAATGADA